MSGQEEKVKQPESSDPPHAESKHELSRLRQVLLAIAATAAYLSLGLLFGLPPPFYPKEAERRGATPTQYGLVFGMVHLSAFLLAPVLSTTVSRAVGPLRLFAVCGAMEAVSWVAFGAIGYVRDDLTLFLALSYALRFLNGACGAGTWVSLMGMLVRLFPERAASVVALTDIGFGVGYALGPPLGSLLYSAGGFGLPFYVMTSLSAIARVAIVAILAGVVSLQGKSKQDTEEPNKETGMSLKDIFKSALMLFPLVDTTLCFCSFGLLESMLEQFMSQSHIANPTQVATTFLAMGAAYLVGTLATGYTCDNLGVFSARVLSAGGNAVMAAALLLLGPAPFVPFAASVASVTTAVAFCGVGFGMVAVSCFSRLHTEAMAKFPLQKDTHVAVSGMWSSAFYLGSFLGPTASGAIVQQLGFPATAAAFAAVAAALVVADAVEVVATSRGRKYGNAEKEKQ